MAGQQLGLGQASPESVQLTPVYGVLSEDPCCYVLEVENMTILLDCGWREPFDMQLIAPLKAWAKKIDVVLISHPDLDHCGALPVLFGQWECPAKLLLTTPSHKLGLMALYDAFMSMHDASHFTSFSLADVDAAFRLVEQGGPTIQLRFWQLAKVSQSAPVEFVAAPAGRTLGGAQWLIKRGEDRVLYAVGLNHREEMHLAGAARGSQAPLLRQPTALITDTLHVLSAADWASPAVAEAAGLGETAVASALALPTRRAVEADVALRLIKEAAFNTLAAGGNVLLPADSSSRVLELLLRLDTEWTGRFPLVFLSRVGDETLRHTRNQLEWMRGDISARFAATRSTPFTFTHVRTVHSRAELSALPRPMAVVTSFPSLTTGFAKQLLLEWCAAPANRIIFSQRAPAGTLGSTLQAQPTPATISVQLTARQPMTEEEVAAAERQEALHRRQEGRQARQEAGEGDQDEAEGVQEVDVEGDVNLEGGGAQSRVPQGEPGGPTSPRATTAEGGGDEGGDGPPPSAGGLGALRQAEVDLPRPTFAWVDDDDLTELPMVGMGGELDTSAVGIPQPLRSRSSPGAVFGSRSSPASPSAPERASPIAGWFASGPEVGGVEEGKAPPPLGGAATSGPIGSAASVLSSATAGTLASTVLPSVRTAQRAAVVTPRAKAQWGVFGLPDQPALAVSDYGLVLPDTVFLEAASKAAKAQGGGGASGPPVPGGAPRPASGPVTEEGVMGALKRHLAELARAAAAGTREGGSADLAMLSADGAGRMKTVTQELSVPLAASVLCIPLDGRPDGVSTRFLLEECSPRQLVLVGGTPESCAWLQEACTGLPGCERVVVPSAGQAVSLDGTAWALLMMKDALSVAGRARVGPYTLLRFSGEVEAPPAGAGGPGSTLLLKEGVAGASSAVARDDALLLRREPLRLAEVRKRLKEAGVPSSFRAGALITEGGVQLRRLLRGKGAGVGGVVLEGPAGREYTAVQKVLYSMHALV